MPAVSWSEAHKLLQTYRSFCSTGKRVLNSRPLLMRSMYRRCPSLGVTSSSSPAIRIRSSSSSSSSSSSTTSFSSESSSSLLKESPSMRTVREEYHHPRDSPIVSSKSSVNIMDLVSVAALLRQHCVQLVEATNPGNTTTQTTSTSSTSAVIKKSSSNDNNHSSNELASLSQKITTSSSQPILSVLRDISMSLNTLLKTQRENAAAAKHIISSSPTVIIMTSSSNNNNNNNNKQISSNMQPGDPITTLLHALTQVGCDLCFLYSHSSMQDERNACKLAVREVADILDALLQQECLSSLALSSAAESVRRSGYQSKIGNDKSRLSILEASMQVFRALSHADILHSNFMNSLTASLDSILSFYSRSPNNTSSGDNSCHNLHHDNIPSIALLAETAALLCWWQNTAETIPVARSASHRDATSSGSSSSTSTSGDKKNSNISSHTPPPSFTTRIRTITDYLCAHFAKQQKETEMATSAPITTKGSHHLQNKDTIISLALPLHLLYVAANVSPHGLAVFSQDSFYYSYDELPPTSQQQQPEHIINESTRLLNLVDMLFEKLSQQSKVSTRDSMLLNTINETLMILSSFASRLPSECLYRMVFLLSKPGSINNTSKSYSNVVPPSINLHQALFTACLVEIATRLEVYEACYLRGFFSSHAPTTKTNANNNTSKTISITNTGLRIDKPSLAYALRERASFQKSALHIHPEKLIPFVVELGYKSPVSVAAFSSSLYSPNTIETVASTTKPSKTYKTSSLSASQFSKATQVLDTTTDNNNNSNSNSNRASGTTATTSWDAVANSMSAPMRSPAAVRRQRHNRHQVLSLSSPPLPQLSTTTTTTMSNPIIIHDKHAPPLQSLSLDKNVIPLPPYVLREHENQASSSPLIPFPFSSSSLSPFYKSFSFALLQGHCRIPSSHLPQLAEIVAPYAYASSPSCSSASHENENRTPFSSDILQNQQVHHTAAAAADILHYIGLQAVGYALAGESSASTESTLIHTYAMFGIPHRALFQAVARRVVARGTTATTMTRSSSSSPRGETSTMHIAALHNKSHTHVDNVSKSRRLINTLFSLSLGWEFDQDAFAVLLRQLRDTFYNKQHISYSSPIALRSSSSQNPQSQQRLQQQQPEHQHTHDTFVLPPSILTRVGRAFGLTHSPTKHDNHSSRGSSSKKSNSTSFFPSAAAAATKRNDDDELSLAAAPDFTWNRGVDVEKDEEQGYPTRDGYNPFFSSHIPTMRRRRTLPPLASFYSHIAFAEYSISKFSTFPRFLQMMPQPLTSISMTIDEGKEERNTTSSSTNTSAFRHIYTPPAYAWDDPTLLPALLLQGNHASAASKTTNRQDRLILTPATSSTSPSSSAPRISCVDYDQGSENSTNNTHNIDDDDDVVVLLQRAVMNLSTVLLCASTDIPRQLNLATEVTFSTTNINPGANPSLSTESLRIAFKAKVIGLLNLTGSRRGSGSGGSSGLDTDDDVSMYALQDRLRLHIQQYAEYTNDYTSSIDATEFVQMWYRISGNHDDDMQKHNHTSDEDEYEGERRAAAAAPAETREMQQPFTRLVIPVALPLHKIAFDITFPSSAITLATPVRKALLQTMHEVGSTNPTTSGATATLLQYNVVPSLHTMWRVATLSANGWTVIAVDANKLASMNLLQSVSYIASLMPETWRRLEGGKR